jgi:hypothetical protein
LNTTTDKVFITIGAQDLCRLHTDTSENQIKRVHLRNLNAFMARLTRDGVSDCSYQALITITQALEIAEMYTTTRIMDVLMVYDWLRLAGYKLMGAKIKNFRVRGELWDKVKQSGYSQERWEFWRRRLGDIEGDGGYEVKTREIAGKAKSLLEKLIERPLGLVKD